VESGNKVNVNSLAIIGRSLILVGDAEKLEFYKVISDDEHTFTIGMLD
jgi:hypothetical protein